MRLSHYRKGTALPDHLQRNDTMNAIETAPTLTLTAGQKAAATKGAHGAKIAGIKAQITRLERIYANLTERKDKAHTRKLINAKIAESLELGVDLRG